MTMRLRVNEHTPLSALESSDGPPGSLVSDADLERAGPLLLVEVSLGARALLQRVLTARRIHRDRRRGRTTGGGHGCETNFAYAVINLRLSDGDSSRW